VPNKDEVLENRVEDFDVCEEEVETDECLQSRIELLEREKAQITQQLLRLKADFENFRRRSRNEKENLVQEANRNLLENLLPVLDNFERALDAQSEEKCLEDPFFQGVKMVSQGLLNVLGEYGLQVINAVGQPFDPDLHDAISLEGEGGDNLVVTQQLQTGYMLYEKVLRHTKVLVGMCEEEEECQK